MIKVADLPDILPLFPLPEALLLPRTRIQLNVFEPRYLAMVEDIMKTRERLIGMIQPLGEDTDGPLHDVGCAGRLSSFIETDDGRYLITLTGVSRFRVAGKTAGDTPYLQAEVNWQDYARDLSGAQHDKGFDRDGFLKLLERFFALEELDTDWENLKQAKPEMLINSLSMLAPFAPEDKQALLEVETLTKRRETLVALLELAVQRNQTGGGLQ